MTCDTSIAYPYPPFGRFVPAISGKQYAQLRYSPKEPKFYGEVSTFVATKDKGKGKDGEHGKD